MRNSHNILRCQKHLEPGVPCEAKNPGGGRKRKEQPEKPGGMLLSLFRKSSKLNVSAAIPLNHSRLHLLTLRSQQMGNLPLYREEQEENRTKPKRDSIAVLHIEDAIAKQIP